jgi:hypothetical protein
MPVSEALFCRRRQALKKTMSRPVSSLMAVAPFSGTGGYGRQLQSLAEEEHCAYLDMITPWVEYILTSGVHPHLLYRDALISEAFCRVSVFSEELA